MNKNIVCDEFVSTGVKCGVCNVYKKLSMPIYPNQYEVEMFCKTDNHQKCPIRISFATDSRVGWVERSETQREKYEASPNVFVESRTSTQPTVSH